MANGTTHDLTCLALGIGLAVAISHLLPDYAHGAMWIGLGAISGRWITPDLDLKNATVKRWGILSFIWVPYRAIIPCHRHWLSHAPIIGTGLRVGYLMALLSPLIVANLGAFVAILPYWFAGLAVADLGHLILDGWNIRQ